MRKVAVIVFLGVVILVYLFVSGQLQIEGGQFHYASPPSHEERFRHSGHKHDLSYCTTTLVCASGLAAHDQKRVGSVEYGQELRSVRAEGVQVIYEYNMPLTKKEFESAIPPPDKWLQKVRDAYCADELNWPMTDLGVVIVMRFFGGDNSSLGEVRIDGCPH